MDVKLSSEQEVLLRSAQGELERHRVGHPYPGPAQSDLSALSVLREAGYLDILEAGGTAVDVVLVIEAAAKLAPGAPVAARALVGPSVLSAALPDVVALGEVSPVALTRFAPEADGFLLMTRDGAWYVDAADVEIEPVTTRWGYPVGRVSPVPASPRVPVDAGALLTMWRIALAAEIGGLMEGATLLASSYVTDRFQFGRSIGSLQSIQHRLARAYIASQATKWAARRAAWDTSDDVAAAAAACYATAEAAGVLASVQQVCGAIGFTDEFGLTRFTARLALLQTELGGASAHARWLSRARWSTPGVSSRST